MTGKELLGLVRAGETDLIEFKQEWWDLTSQLGKGQLVRSVLAMANACTPTERGVIIFGIKDKRAGGQITGVSKPPTQEAVAQILDMYTNPVPRIRLSEARLKKAPLSVLEVLWSDSHPHYATRDVDTILSTDAVYTRRAGTVGRLKPVEVERLIRAKDARLGKIPDQAPLTAGFVELPLPGGFDQVSVKVTNVTEEPVTDITVMVDIHPIQYPSAAYRRPLLTNLTLPAGSTREATFRLSDAQFWKGPQEPLQLKGFIWSSWINLHLLVRYRDRGGFYARLERTVSLD